MSKLQTLKDKWAAGDFRGALYVAAKFPSLGKQKKPITRAWTVWTNPAIYREMGLDPAAIVLEGLRAMAEKYKLDGCPTSVQIDPL